MTDLKLGELEFKAEDFANILWFPDQTRAEQTAQLANRILAEKLAKAQKDQPWLTVHGHQLTQMRNGSLWWEGPDGDGMELSKASLDKIFSEYM